MLEQLNFLYKNDEERNKLKQHFIDNANRIDKNKKTILFSTPLILAA